MKHLISIVLLCVLTVSIFAQDRTPPTRRLFQPSPQLVTYPDTDSAAGIAQTAYGYALSLSGPVPAGSIVGIYGYRLVSSSASKVLLWSDAGVMVVDCDAWRYAFFEMVTFRLPENLHGDVWVTTLGRQTSNTVKITVE